MRIETEFAIAMRRAGLNQKAMARLAGVSRYTVARWMHKDKTPAPEYAWTIVRLSERSQQAAATP